MDTLPQDPNMLVSVLNMKMRDNDMTLDELCRAFDIDRDVVEARLAAAGFKYNAEARRFV